MPQVSQVVNSGPAASARTRSTLQFAQYDHPAEHSLFIQDGAPLSAPPPPPAPRIAFPGGSGDPISLVSDGEEVDEAWSLPPSQMAIHHGLSVMRGAAAGPQDIRLARRKMVQGSSMGSMMAEMAARQDKSAAAAARPAQSSDDNGRTPHTCCRCQTYAPRTKHADGVVEFGRPNSQRGDVILRVPSLTPRIVLTSLPQMTQIISGATGSDFDPSVWQLPEIRTQVKEIDN